MERRFGGYRCVAGLSIALGMYVLVMHAVLERSWHVPAPLPLGAQGDQVFYAWAIERARASSSFERYVLNCDWSASGCTDLRSVPQEWTSLFLLGKLARLARIDSASFLSAWYFLAILLNAFAAAWFIAAVSGQWLLGGALAALVAMQQSLLFRLNGHLSLAPVWQLVGAMAAFWQVLEAVRDRLLRRAFAIRLLAFLVLLLAAAVGSYYYLIFGLLLFPQLLLAFLILNWRKLGGLDLLRRREPRLVVGGIAVTAAVFLWATDVGTRGQHHADSYQRTADDVRKCSATWVDYVKPTGLSGAIGLLDRAGLSLSQRELGDRWPHETHSFLGATFWAAVAVTAFAGLASFARRPGVPGPPDRERGDRIRRAALFAGMAAVTAFLGTGRGGALIHHFVSGLRCFGRFAPFVTLFGCAAVATCWSRSGRVVPVLVGMLALGTWAEHRHDPILRPELVQSSEGELRLADALRQRCREGVLSVDPPVPDFMFGPYRIYYVAQLAGCRMDGIQGSGFVPVASAARARVAGVLKWNPPGYGWETIVVSDAPGPAAAPPAAPEERR